MQQRAKSTFASKPTVVSIELYLWWQVQGRAASLKGVRQFLRLRGAAERVKFFLHGEQPDLAVLLDYVAG